MQKQRIKELFDLAVQRQTKEMVDAVQGCGIDNHLAGLRYAAKEAGDPMPEIFTDEAFRLVHHFGLSTSQVALIIIINHYCIQISGIANVSITEFIINFILNR